MKKTTLLTSLLVSVASIAGTSGFVEAYNENKTIYSKGQDFNLSFKNTESTFGVKTEAKVKDTGLLFGADIKAKDYPIFGNNGHETLSGNIKKHIEIYGKYELPKINNLNSYVKASYKTGEKSKVINGGATSQKSLNNQIIVEADASYDLTEKLSAGLNSKTVFEFPEQEGLTADSTRSTHKIYLKGEHGAFKDIYAQLGVEHSYGAPVAPMPQPEPKLLAPTPSDTPATTTVTTATPTPAAEPAAAPTTAATHTPSPTTTPTVTPKTNTDVAAQAAEPQGLAKNVFLNVKASYEATKDLTLTGKIDFKHTFNNGEMDDDSILLGDSGKLTGKYRHSYLLGAKYIGLKDTELKLDAFVEHNLIHKTSNNGPNSRLYFGFKPEVKYTGIPNLVLSSKNIFGGKTEYKFGTDAKTETKGHIKLNANAEYTYMITDKFTVKPSLDLTSEFKDIDKTTYNASIEITPKVKAEYKPIENLTILGDIAPVFKFNDTINSKKTFSYVNTTVKSSLNIKYTW